MSSRNARRVMLAVTASSALQDLWRAAIEHTADEQAELLTLLVRDDRWRRAASLPFTREVSRASGGSANFTPRRAEEVDRDAGLRTQGRLRELASDSRIPLAFETLAEHEAIRIHEFVKSESDLLIAPSFFKERAFYSEIARLKCKILLIDTQEASASPER